MPGKAKKAKGGGPKKDTSEMETPFDPVPYETLDVCTSISLLTSPELEVLLRALYILAKYADKSDVNVMYLYKNEILPKLLNHILSEDLVVVRFVYKLIGQLVSIIKPARLEMCSDQAISKNLEINATLMKTSDVIVQEFCTQILSHTVSDAYAAGIFLDTGVIQIIFKILTTSEDPDVQLNTLKYLLNLLEAHEAKHVIPKNLEFSTKTILCYLKSKLADIRDAALNMIDKMTSWNSSDMQNILKDERVVETMFEIIFNKEFRAMHEKAFKIIIACTNSVETSSYFVKSEQFIQFCEWAKLCPGKYILPSTTITTSLTEKVELRQMLFDFAVENTILSFFRTQNEMVFYKTCEAVINMSTHRFCCKKILTPVVLKCLMNMLRQKNVPIIPFHEMALTTLYIFMKRNESTISMLVAYREVDLITECLLIDKREYTYDGFITLLDILYILANHPQTQQQMVDRQIYRLLLDTFEEEPQELSEKALLVLNQFVDNAECRQFFIEMNGPQKVLVKIKSTPNEDLFKNMLVFIQRLFIYKRIAMAFLWSNCPKILQQICEEVVSEIPQINHTINMMYDLYLPLKFHELGRLDVTDHFNGRFYLINGEWKHDFPFLEVLMKQKISLRCTLYLVDFSANVTELMQKVARVPTSILQLGIISKTPASHTRFGTNQSEKRRSILKRGSSIKSQKVSIQLNGDYQPSESNLEQKQMYLVWQSVPPPINYGCISEDPYLPKYVEKLRVLLFGKNVTPCFRHQVCTVAKFVRDLLSGPDEEDPTSIGTMPVHIANLKNKLGTFIIPLGYLRCGNYCERALLFKSLAEKVHIPSSLVRGKSKETNNFVYWNEVPLVAKETYACEEDDEKTYMSYAVVDLINNVGNLMLVGSFEANKYCQMV